MRDADVARGGVPRDPLADNAEMASAVARVLSSFHLSYTVSTLVVLFSRGCSLPLSLFLALSFLFSSSNTPDITTLTWGGLESLRDTFVDSRGRSPHGCISLFNESPRVVLLSRASSTHVTSQISTDVRNRRRRRRPGSLESIAAPHSASRPSDDDDDDDDEELPLASVRAPCTETVSYTGRVSLHARVDRP